MSARGTGSRHSGEHAESGRRGGARVAVAIVVAVILIIVAVAVYGWSLVSSALDLRGRAQTLTVRVEQVQATAQAGDWDALGDGIDALADEVESIRQTTDGALWTTASHLPVVGADVASARELVNVADDLVSQALVPAGEVLRAHPVEEVVSGNAVDLEALQEYVDLFEAIGPVLDESSNRLEGLGFENVQALDGVASQLRDRIDQVRALKDALGPALPILPGLLGANGPRTYLIVAQTNSEIRSTGGFPGAMCVVDAVDGHVTLDEVVSMTSFGLMDRNAGQSTGVTEFELSVFGRRSDYISGDVNYCPDFPRDCEMWNTCWEQKRGVVFDGMIAVDPLAFQEIVGLVGDVAMSDGSVLTAENAARTILHDVYVTYQGQYEAQDAYFVEAATRTFEMLVSGSGNAGIGILDIIGALERSASGGHLLAWSADDAEEQTIEQMGCAGHLGSPWVQPELGVYVSNDTWSKTDWWLDLRTQIGEAVKNADGSQTYTVQTTLANTITPEEIEQSDYYMIGGHQFVYEVGEIADWVYLVSPPGGSIQILGVSGVIEGDWGWSEGMLSCEYMGCAFTYGYAHVPPGATVVIDYTVTVPADLVNDEVGLRLRQTPTGQVFS